jgi:ribosomal protein S16
MVVCEKRLKRNGKVKEILGVFDPFHPEQKKINQELVDLWLKRGAQISPKCQKILR